MSDLLIWAGIVVCVSQSACFSGLNLAFFSLSRLELEIEAGRGDKAAAKILRLREDANYLLTTILWGNVGINVLLTLLSDSVLAGVAGFLFSTFAITLFGEIAPQAYFSRNAKQMASLLSPLLHFYQVLLYPVAKPSALLLDLWLGKEGIQYLREHDLKAIIRKHVEAEEAEVAAIEGVGAINFLAIDDLPASAEGEILNDESIIQLPERKGLPQFPAFSREASDPFLQQVNRSGYSWVVLTNPQNQPVMVVDADGFLRDALLDLDRPFNPYDHCHRPIVVTNPADTLGDLILQLKLQPGETMQADSAITNDVILVWAADRRKIITGADIFGRLLRGIERYATPPSQAADNKTAVAPEAPPPR